MPIVHKTVPYKHRFSLAMAAAVLLSFGFGWASSLLFMPHGGPGRTVMVKFSLYAPEAREVSLAGDFNEWNITADPLVQGKNGVWSIMVPLTRGRYSYMFLVDGKTWTSDPGVNHHIDDGFGRMNAVLDLS